MFTLRDATFFAWILAYDMKTGLHRKVAHVGSSERLPKSIQTSPYFVPFSWREKTFFSNARLEKFTLDL